MHEATSMKAWNSLSLQEKRPYEVGGHDLQIVQWNSKDHIANIERLICGNADGMPLLAMMLHPRQMLKV